MERRTRSRRTTRTSRPGPRCSTRFWSKASGPWGSVFSRDDFTDREVQDTDGDGLARVRGCVGPAAAVLPVAGALSLGPSARAGDPSGPEGREHSWDLLPPYQSVNSATSGAPTRRCGVSGAGTRHARPQSATDGPAVVVSDRCRRAVGGQQQFAVRRDVGRRPASVGASGGVQAFEYFFHRLTEPISPGSGAVLFWDRGGSFARRAFYSKFLILSGGRDKQPGVFLYSDADMKTLGDNAAAAFLIANENNALPFALDMLGGGTRRASRARSRSRPDRRDSIVLERVFGRSDASVELRPSASRPRTISATTTFSR